MIERLGETIVAISSPPGQGPVGIVRLSGPRAIQVSLELAGDNATRDKIAKSQGGRRIEGAVRATEDLSAPAAFLVFNSPRSYTREDLVEIHTVGSPPLLEMIRDNATSLGAIAAAPGEFTARAFLSGRMDVTRAEAVATTIHAESDTQLRASRRMTDGSLTKMVRSSRDELKELVALVEADIDFAEEPIDFISPSAIRVRASTARESLAALAGEHPTVEQLTQLPHVLLLGPPNAGKSTLMNRLTGLDRAICSAVAGTTRDVLSAPMKIGRGEAILLDAAGLDESTDPVIATARAKALLTAEQVDLVCLVVDATEATGESLAQLTRDLRLPQTITVANKSDLLNDAPPQIADAITVSALTGQGIEDLRQAIASALASKTQTVGADAVLLTNRQQTAIQEAIAALDRACELAANASETIDCADVLAFELRDALDALARVTGEVTTDDLLAHVFANFCVGK